MSKQESQQEHQALMRDCNSTHHPSLAGTLAQLQVQIPQSDGERLSNTKCSKLVGQVEVEITDNSIEIESNEMVISVGSSRQVGVSNGGLLVDSKLGQVQLEKKSIDVHVEYDRVCTGTMVSLSLRLKPFITYY